MRIVDIIEKKAGQQCLTDEELKTFIHAVYEKKSDDAQIGAFLMAVRLNDMNDDECASLTAHMSNYGDRLEWSNEWAAQVVDKHSTGGVGDKISLILAPAVAACGGKVPMISGRGLGFTGGTLDKLEAIPGFMVEIPIDKMKKIVEDVGVFIAGQTPHIAPVDKRLYSLRDISATVKSDPLIVSSIMSKKNIEGLKVLILDVKVGKAAFMKEEEDAKQLAMKMIRVGEKVGIKMIACLTRMDQPIGFGIGNALEVADALQSLNNHMANDQRELVVYEAGLLLHRAGLAASKEEGQQKIKAAIADGRALAKFEEMIIAQGVDPDFAQKLCAKGSYPVTHYMELMGHKSADNTPLKADRNGIVTDMDALTVAEKCMKLGAGRASKEDKLDYSVGIYLHKKVGDRISTGDVWAEVFHQNPLTKDDMEAFKKCLTIEEKTNFSPPSMILKTLTKDDDNK